MSAIVRGAQLARMLNAWQVAVGVRGPAGKRPEYVILANAVRGLLIDGRLALGVRLPAERELAAALGISRTTVTAAYRELRESGHVSSRRGAGSWTELPAGHRVGTTGLWTPSDEAGLIDLGCAAMPAPPELTAAAAEAVTDLEPYTAGPGYQPMGLLVLREAIAGRYTERGLPTSPDQVMITGGVQQALDLLLRLLVAPGQRALVETPTYPNALSAFISGRARLSSYAIGPDGWDADLLLSTVRAAQARVAYLIPEFHNPTGHLMPAGLREKLPPAAHAAGTDLIIDESFVDLALDDDLTADGAMPPAVAGFDRTGRVLTIGGMSKAFWGGLRIGWVRGPGPLIARLAAARVGVDMASPVLDQLVATRLLQRRDTIVSARRKQLLVQRDTLAAALRAELPEWRFVLPRGGMVIWAELDAPVSSALARSAEELGVRVAPGPRFGADGTMERFMRLPFTLPETDLIEAVRRLAEARTDLDRPRRHAWSAQTILA
ncbi:PLP-dependent aminotransferase family protein [Dactylosporangium matsuzakiense]|uniref:GntR family transcriptional regulator n=1 Tax=Dactylosporangium matsuzakiense TaxID=53360 RepID=A0A9W6KPA1_9ACTN|nr:PLP-dependent aminotransferase family protein [Dactylosporangium matsuzakiense]UWZ43328.1 PLP-dependent aminotransferase family protein [Dactylosporangium matsuzakiense]GLL05078.1 GntR family transcriptional regulator [Dactylosporangium matsuzakiense]